MQNFTCCLITETLNDVVVTGFINANNKNQSIFHPLYDRLFFIFDQFIYQIYLDDGGFIQANIIDKINLWFDIDDDDQFLQMSIYSQMFKTEQEIKVLKANYQHTSLSSLFITYIEGDIERDIVLDPRHFFGFTFY
ncbi:unnamed protein product [Commensalibacter communis]|uniref:hypothetical protein n=1 Tax=Commensalibacter communis TaxID=2972786 RepID=UPI0022FFB6C7|nr:hypothetical protein [Commensalibacter communis]CAI3922601.1 unnamed protein product [Commensalibacter communis]